MAYSSNLSAKFCPLRPSLNNGRVQRRIRRAYIATGKLVLSTSELLCWTHPRPGGNLAGIETIIAELFEAPRSAIANALVAVRPEAGARSCGACATMGTINGRMEKP